MNAGEAVDWHGEEGGLPNDTDDRCLCVSFFLDCAAKEEEEDMWISVSVARHRWRLGEACRGGKKPIVGPRSDMSGDNGDNRGGSLSG